MDDLSTTKQSNSFQELTALNGKKILATNLRILSFSFLIIDFDILPSDWPVIAGNPLVSLFKYRPYLYSLT